MNDEEKDFQKKETVNQDNPGFNGNFETLIPTEEECDKAAEKCKSAYKALMKTRNLKVGDNDGKQE